MMTSHTRNMLEEPLKSNLNQIVYLVVVGEDGYVAALFPDQEEAKQYALKALKKENCLSIQGTRFGERNTFWLAEYELIGHSFGAVVGEEFIRTNNEFLECIYEHVDEIFTLTSRKKVQV